MWCVASMCAASPTAVVEPDEPQAGPGQAQRQRGAGKAGDGIAVLHIAVADPPFIPQRNRAFGVASAEAYIHASGQAAVGDHIIARRKFRRQHLRRLDIGLNRNPPAALLRGVAALRLGKDRQRRGNGDQRGEQAKLAAMRKGHFSSLHIRNRPRSGDRWG